MKYKLSVLVGLLVCLVAFGKAEAAVVAYWSMDEGSGSIAHDTSGNGNNGTLTNMDPNTAWEEWGVKGGALYFDGEPAGYPQAGGYYHSLDDYLEVPDAASLDFGTGSFTIELWAYWDDLSKIRMLVDNRDASAGNAGIYILHVPGEKLYFGVQDAAGNSGQTVGGTTLSAGQWYHIVAVGERPWLGMPHPNGSIRLYVNGSFYSQLIGASLSTVGAINGAGFDIGKFFVDTWHYLNHRGLIDEVRVYNTALTDAEILSHYVDGLISIKLSEFTGPITTVPQVNAEIDRLYRLVQENADAIAELDRALDALAAPGASGISRYQRD